MSTTTGFKQDVTGSYIPKDPSAELSYSIDWSDWLQTDDTITSSTWTVAVASTSTVDTSTLAIEANTITDNTTTSVTVSGGTAGNIYNLTNKVWTNDDLIDLRTFRVKVETRYL